MTEDIKRSTGRWAALGALVLSSLVIGLDITVLVTALPTLSAKLGATTSELQWISTAYTLAIAGLLLPAGVFADRYGRKRMLLIGLAVFGVSSLVASQVTTATALIWMRAVMGAAAAIVLPLMLAILPSIFSEAERPRAVALATAGAFLGLPLGPLVAGWLLNHYAWGSVFLINAPVVVVSLAAVWRWVPESRDPDSPRLDIVGTVLAIAGVTAMVYGIIQEPLNGWTDRQVLAGLIGGGVLTAVFVIWELRNPQPLVDLRIFADPRFAWPAVTFTVISFALTGVLFILTPYLQIVLGNDAQGTGIRLLPLIGALLVAAVSSDRLSARLGVRVMVAGGLVVTAAGVVLLGQVAAGTDYTPVAVALAVAGFGMGLAMPPAVDALLQSLPADRTGSGTALQRAVQQVGASFGVAVMGSILNSVYRADMAPHLAGLPGAVSSAAESSVAGAFAVAARLPAPVAQPLLRAARDAYAHGMAEVLLVSAASLLLLAVLVAIFQPVHSSQTKAVPAKEATVP